MKREIKFGAKAINNDFYKGAWVDGYYTKRLWDEKLVDVITDGSHEIPIQIETLGQFTGVKYDDIEIYEHDLVECVGVLCEVVYSDKIGSIVLLEVLSQNLGNKPIGQMIDMFGIKYVGNIYDNPELLKVCSHD